MQEFDHTSREDYTYTEQEKSCPYFDNCYIQVRNQGACRFMCKDNPAYNIRVDKNKSNRAVYEAWCGKDWPIGNPNKEYVSVSDFGMAMCNRKRGKKR